MLFINRNSEDWDWLLATNLYRTQKQLIEDNLLNSTSANDLLSLRAPTDIRHTKEQLMREFRGKCAYCENQTNQFSYHRPQFNSQPNLAPSSEENFYYVWLSWEWINFYLVCEDCASSKGTQFPVKGRRAEFESTLLERINNLETPLERINKLEQPLLLDPCFDNPNLHLEFSADGTVKERSERGRVTINTLDLNQADLCHKRIDIAEKMKKDFQLALRSLSSEVLLTFTNNTNARSSDDSRYFFEALSQHRKLECSFAAMRHQLLLSWLRFLREYLENDEDIDDNNPLAKRTRSRNVLLLNKLFQQNESCWNDLILYLENWFFQPSSNGEMPQLETQSWLIETLRIDDENSIRAELINTIPALPSVPPSKSPLTSNDSSLQKLWMALKEQNLSVLSDPQRYRNMLIAALEETTNYVTEEVKIIRIPLKALLAFLEKP